MKSLFFVVALMFATSNASAITLLSHKDTSTGITKLDAKAVEAAWSSNVPACLKDGSRLMGVNAAFKAKKLKYSDCSSSGNALEKQRMLGYQVTVIRFTELPDTMAKAVMGK